MCFYIFTAGLATLAPLNVSPGSAPTLPGLCPPSGNGDWAVASLRGDTWPGLEPGKETACEQSQL